MMRVLGLLMFAAAIPFFIALLSSQPRSRRYLWPLIGLIPFIIGLAKLDVSIMSWAYWPGYVKGMIVSLLDALAIAILVTTRRRPEMGVLLPMYILYLVGSSVAIAFATTPLASFFFAWQLGRAILVFAAVVIVAAQPRGPQAIVDGLALGALVEAGFTLWQRAHGVIQATGTMGHQNLLGMAMHFALFPCLAMVLSGDRRVLPKLGVAASAVAIALTGSRGSTGLAGMGAVALLLLSLVRRPTPFKLKAVSGGIVLLLIAAPVAYLNLQKRFAAAPIIGGEEERAAFERAAWAIWTDRPMGIGANQYVVVSNAEGYAERAGVIWNSGSRAANVHNAYLLIASETGWLGITTFLALLLTAIVVAARSAWGRPRGWPGELSLGVLVALSVVALHNLYEWVFVTYVVQYLLAIALGLMVGARHQQVTASAKPRADHAPPARRPRVLLARDAALANAAPSDAMAEHASKGRPPRQG